MPKKSSAIADLTDATEVRAGEFRKSGETRRRILDAGVACLAREGYCALSVAQVAAAAGLSRAAMIYHFPTRRDLVEALIGHVTRLRVERYEAEMAQVPHDGDFGARAVALAWEHAQRPEFAAFAELAQSARTDPELAAMFRPAMAAFDQSRRSAAGRIFPTDVVAQEGFDLSRDVLRFLMEGVVQQGGIVHDSAIRLAALRHFMRLLVTSEAGWTLLEESMAAARAALEQP